MIKILVVCLTLLASCGGWCKVDARRLSQQELELRSQLKALNKPPIKSFKKDDGNIIDCIDIYKQPALDHPLLKDHKIQMRPSSALQNLAKSKLVQDDKIILDPKSQVQYDCPSGSVPIRRTRRRDLINSKSALNHYRTMITGPPFIPQQGFSFAGVTTQTTGEANRYLGAEVLNSLYNLSVINSQISTASLRIGNGVDGSFSSIEYGWTLNHELYGDTKARTFSLWTADGFEKTGCFNTLCPGFVQVHPDRPMGDEITYFSEYDDSKKFMMYAIIKDEKTKDWWIVESIPDKPSQYIGYWPRALFPNMAEFATNVQAGGKVMNPSLEPSKTPMGSGHYKSEDFLKTADMLVQVFNSSFIFMDDPQMVAVANTPDLYKAQFLDQGELLYGGPDFPA